MFIMMFAFRNLVFNRIQDDIVNNLGRGGVACFLSPRQVVILIVTRN